MCTSVTGVRKVDYLRENIKADSDFTSYIEIIWANIKSLVKYLNLKESFLFAQVCWCYLENGF